MESIFSFNIMIYFTDFAIASGNNSSFIIFPRVLSLNITGTNKKRIYSIAFFFV